MTSARPAENALAEIADCPEPLGPRNSPAAAQCDYLKGIARAALAAVREHGEASEVVSRDDAHGEASDSQPVLRVGRKVGRTLYRQLGSEPSNDDPLVGVMDTPELAAQVARALAAVPADQPASEETTT